MTITKEQLDELEHEAYVAKCKAANAALRGIALSLEDSTRSRSAAVTLSLVAIARAALEWKDAMSVDDYRRQDKACEALAGAVRGTP